MGLQPACELQCSHFFSELWTILSLHLLPTQNYLFPFLNDNVDLKKNQTKSAEWCPAATVSPPSNLPSFSCHCGYIREEAKRVTFPLGSTKCSLCICVCCLSTFNQELILNLIASLPKRHFCLLVLSARRFERLSEKVLCLSAQQ